MFFQTNPTFTTDIKTSVETVRCEEKPSKNISEKVLKQTRFYFKTPLSLPRMLTFWVGWWPQGPLYLCPPQALSQIPKCQINEENRDFNIIISPKNDHQLVVQRTTTKYFVYLQDKEGTVHICNSESRQKGANKHNITIR